MTERPILFSGPMVRAILDGRKTQTRRLVKIPRHVGNDIQIDPAGRLSYSACVCSAPGQEAFETWTHQLRSPYGQPGDRLWIRERWAPQPYHLCSAEGCDCDDVRFTYPADGMTRICTMPEGWTPPGGWARYERSPLSAPSIHMPRWASRLTLEVTSVRVERLQSISEEDALAEGIPSELTPLAAEFLGEEGRQWIGPTRLERMTRGRHLTEVVQKHWAARTAFEDWWDFINGDRAAWASNPWVWCVGFKRVEAADAHR